MSETQNSVGTGLILEAAELENVLGGLEETLVRQMELLTEEKFDDFINTSDDVALMLNRITTAKAPLTWKCFERIKKIHGLHHALGLTLATKSQEMAQGLTKMRSGKNVLKAYKAGG